MRQQRGNLPTYIALGLAVVAAIMSSSRHQPNVGADLDAALLSLLTIQALATDMPQSDPEQPMLFASP